MELSRLKVEDAEALAQFYDLQIEYEESLPADLRHNSKAPSSAHVYNEPNAAFLALAERVSAGCVAVWNLDRSTDIIQRLYVRPAYRGRGIARALIEAALAFAREHRRGRVVLDTDRARLSAAYQLYRSIGFTECEPYGPVDYATPTFMQLYLSRKQ